MVDGIAGLPFVNDMIFQINDKWKPSNGGRKPNITAKWKTKNVGHGNKLYDEIIVFLDSENPNIFSMISEISNGKFSYDWLHDISITLDVYTSQSEDRVLQMVNECVRILKNNVVTKIRENEYVQILPGNIVSLNEEMRNIYRYTIDVDALRYNP